MVFGEFLIAKKRGVKFGRPVKATSAEFAAEARLWANKQLDMETILEKHGICQAVFIAGSEHLSCLERSENRKFLPKKRRPNCKKRLEFLINHITTALNLSIAISKILEKIFIKAEFLINLP